MPIRVVCSCGKRLAIKEELAGRRVRCPTCQGVVAVPTLEEPRLAEPRPMESEPGSGFVDSADVRATTGLDGVHLFAETPVGRMIPLGIFTANIFAMIWLNLLHGKMPLRRPSDPSAGKAIGFLFIPFFNLYWFLFTYIRLLTRINELRVYYSLPPLNMRWVVVVLFVLTVIPWAGVANSLVFVPLFLTAVQSAVNSLVEASAIPAKKRTAATAMIAQYRACGHLRKVWGWYLAIWVGPLVVITGLIAIDEKIEAVFMFLVAGATSLLTLGSVTAFWRSGRMNRSLMELTANPSSMSKVLVAERVASIRVRLLWAFVCALVPVFMLFAFGWQMYADRKYDGADRPWNSKDHPEYSYNYDVESGRSERFSFFDELYVDDIVKYTLMLIPWVVVSGILLGTAIRMPRIELPAQAPLARPVARQKKTPRENDR